MSRFLLLISSSLGALALVSTHANAQQTTESTETYSYDALGRLIIVHTAGGDNEGETHSLCYDASGNRTDYTATSDATLSACIDDGSGGAPPPPPPPPPVMIELTDNMFNVLPAYAAEYDCQKGEYLGTAFEFCRVLPSLEVVYSIYANPQFDTHYAMPVPHTFLVEDGYKGTHD